MEFVYEGTLSSIHNEDNNVCQCSYITIIESINSEQRVNDSNLESIHQVRGNENESIPAKCPTEEPLRTRQAKC